MNKSQQAKFGDLDAYAERFTCLNEGISVTGSFDSISAKQLVIQFHKCSGLDSCKSTSEIQSWLKRKYVSLIHNHSGLHADLKTILNESKITQVPIDSRMSQEHAFNIEATKYRVHKMMMSKQEAVEPYV